MNIQTSEHSAKQRRHHRLATVLSLIGMCIISIWTFYELGGFDLRSVISLPTGARTVVNTFATVDHPFHATRAYLLLESLRNGELLRWIPSHEGGYPAEFYPLGIPWLEVTIWALLLGQVSIVAVHTVVVLMVFVLPGVGFWILTRGDRSSPFVPLLALAIHVSVPGDWMHGGRMELVYWGLIANVGGATLAFIMFAALTRWVREGSSFYAVVAVLCTVAALYTNTRSSIAIVVATLAVILSAAVAISSQAENRGAAVRQLVGRTTLVALLSALLVAPLLLPAIQYAHLYYFVNFESYNNLSGIVWASKTAITPIVAILAVAGCLLSLTRNYTQQIFTVALCFVMYFSVTVGFSLVPWLAGLIQQLETPRLMPFQRFIAIYLAAWFVGQIVSAGIRRFARAHQAVLSGGILIGATLLVVFTFQGRLGELPLVYQPPIPWTTGYSEYGYFEDSVTEISRIAPDGTTVYIVGDQMNWWHEQLWAPTWSDREFFYDDWMWYWHPDHEGPYDPSVGHAYQGPSQSFVRDWFDAHGIGAVLVTDMPVPVGAQNPRQAAASNPLLEFQQSVGNWDLYLVTDPVTMVTNGETNASSVTTDGGLIAATFDGGATGEIEIRRNWFPRWEAWADGEPIEIERTANGYMRVTVPEGTTTVELRYGVTSIDWLGRLLAVGGVVGLAAFVVRRPARFWDVVIDDQPPTGATSPSVTDAD